jgi:type I restriction enzyme S subunit
VTQDCSSGLPAAANSRRFDKFRLRAGDVLVAMTGERSVGKLGRMRKIDREYLVNQRVAIIRPLPDQGDPDYLFHVLTMEKYEKTLSSYGLGAGQPNINPVQIASLMLPLPPLGIQRKIGSILTGFEDLIENNNERIRILESLAQSIYRKCFVDFRFPRRGKLTWVESPLGKIPKGWRVSTLGELIQFQTGSTIKPDPKGAYALYGSNGLIGKSSGFQFERGMIIGRVGNYCGSVQYSHSPFCASGNTVIALPLEGKDELIPYLYYTLKHLSLGQLASGSAQPQITQSLLKSQPVLIAPESLLKKFCSITFELLHQIDHLKKENENLHKTRELLLPELISGRLDLERVEIEAG